MRKEECKFLIIDKFEDLKKLKTPVQNRCTTSDIAKGNEENYTTMSVKSFQRRLQNMKTNLLMRGWANSIVINCWDNGDGTFLLQDANTRTVAVYELVSDGKMKMPEIRLRICNDTMTYDEFISDLKTLNQYAGYKWDVVDNLDYSARVDGNTNSNEIRELSEFYDIAPGSVFNICTHSQGGTKQTVDFDKYVDGELYPKRREILDLIVKMNEVYRNAHPETTENKTKGNKKKGRKSFTEMHCINAVMGLFDIYYRNGLDKVFTDFLINNIARGRIPFHFPEINSNDAWRDCFITFLKETCHADRDYDISENLYNTWVLEAMVKKSKKTKKNAA